MSCPRTIRFLIVIALCSLTSILYAQGDEQRARARTAADQGAQAFDQGRYAEAISAFQRAETIVHAPPHLLFIARAQAKLGKLTSAIATYRKVAGEALGPNSPPPFRAAQAEARSELRELEARIPKLEVVVAGAGDRAVTVAVDGIKLPAASLRSPLVLDPGDHFVTATAGGARQSRTVFLSEGARESVVLDFAGTPTLAPKAQEKADGSSKGGLVAGSIAAFGIGVAGVAGGTYFALQSDRKHDEAKAICEDGCPVSRKDEIDGLYSDAKSLQTLSAVSFIGGGLGLITGTTLLIMAGSDSGREKQSGSVTPYVGVGTAGVRGRF